MKVRAVAAIALSGALALGLSGCNVIGHAPAATTDRYDPSDGVNVTVGKLTLGNLFVITEDGQLGSLVGSAANNSTEDVEFTLQWSVDGTWHSVDLVAGAKTRTAWGFGEGASVQLSPVGKPGSVIDAAVVVDGQTISFHLPVLDTALPEYTGLEPVPAPEPTITAEPEVGDSIEVEIETDTESE